MEAKHYEPPKRREEDEFTRRVDNHPGLRGRGCETWPSLAGSPCARAGPYLYVVWAGRSGPEPSPADVHLTVVDVNAEGIRSGGVGRFARIECPGFPRDACRVAISCVGNRALVWGKSGCCVVVLPVQGGTFVFPRSSSRSRPGPSQGNEGVSVRPRPAWCLPSKDQVRVVKAIWHPLSNSHVLVYTSDGELTLYDVSRREGGGVESRYTVGGNVVDISFGTGLYWEVMTVYLLSSDGSVRVLCPVIPHGCVVSKASLSRMFSWAKKYSTIGLSDREATETQSWLNDLMNLWVPIPIQAAAAAASGPGGMPEHWRADVRGRGRPLKRAQVCTSPARRARVATKAAPTFLCHNAQYASVLLVSEGDALCAFVGRQPAVPRLGGSECPPPPFSSVVRVRVKYVGRIEWLGVDSVERSVILVGGRQGSATVDLQHLFSRVDDGDLRAQTQSRLAMQNEEAALAWAPVTSFAIGRYIMSLSARGILCGRLPDRRSIHQPRPESESMAGDSPSYSELRINIDDDIQEMNRLLRDFRSKYRDTDIKRTIQRLVDEEKMPAEESRKGNENFYNYRKTVGELYKKASKLHEKVKTRLFLLPDLVAEQKREAEKAERMLARRTERQRVLQRDFEKCARNARELVKRAKWCVVNHARARNDLSRAEKTWMRKLKVQKNKVDWFVTEACSLKQRTSAMKNAGPTSPALGRYAGHQHIPDIVKHVKDHAKKLKELRTLIVQNKLDQKPETEQGAVLGAADDVDEKARAL